MTTRTHSAEGPQLDLLGGTSSGEVHRLFLALWPSDTTRAAVSRVAEALDSGQSDWRPRLVRPARYHATLHFLGDHPHLRPDVVAAVIAAAKKVDAQAFTWRLDHADSFQGREPPRVLCSSEISRPMQIVWEQWRRALILAGQGAHLERHFTPHVTLAYAQRSLMQVAAIEPVSWPVNEVVLIHSVKGRPDYQTLARFPLGTKATTAQ